MIVELLDQDGPLMATVNGTEDRLVPLLAVSLFAWTVSRSPQRGGALGT